MRSSSGSWTRAFVSCLIASACCARAVAQAKETVNLLDGELKLTIPSEFLPDKEPASRQSIADFKAKTGDAWGSIARGTRGLQLAGLSDYMNRKVAEYTKGLSWLPRLVWLTKELITINGRQWADPRFIAPREKARNPRDGLTYTRILGTFVGSQLLEIVFTSNTDPDSKTKNAIDQFFELVKLEE